MIYPFYADSPAPLGDPSLVARSHPTIQVAEVNIASSQAYSLPPKKTSPNLLFSRACLCKKLWCTPEQWVLHTVLQPVNV
jgi:hypothetical protein